MILKYAATAMATATVVKLFVRYKSRDRQLRMVSSPLKNTRIDRDHNDQTRDYQGGSHKRNEKNTPSAGRKFPTYNPVLDISSLISNPFPQGPITKSVRPHT